MCMASSFFFIQGESKIWLVKIKKEVELIQLTTKTWNFACTLQN